MLTTKKDEYTFTQEQIIRDVILSQADPFYTKGFNAGDIITVHKILIDAAQAATILDYFNKNNRKPYLRNIEGLVEAMTWEDWFSDVGLVHVLIGLGHFMIKGKLWTNGSMQDGQHVLKSIIKTGKPQRISFSFNGNMNHRCAIDNCKSRTTGQRFALEGKTDEEQGRRGIAAQIITCLLRDVFGDKGKPQTDRLEAIYGLLYKEINWVAEVTRDCVKRDKIFKKTPFRTAAVVTLMLNMQLGKTLISEVVHGAERVGGPAYKLREDLVCDESKGSNNFTGIASVFSLVFNAFKEVRTGIVVEASRRNRKDSIDFPELREDLYTKHPTIRKNVVLK